MGKLRVLAEIADDLWTGFIIIAAFIFIGLPLEADMKIRDASAKIEKFFSKHRKKY